MNTTTAARHATATCPAGMHVDQWMRSRLGTRATRRHDWNALNFHADFDPEHASAPMLLRGRVTLIAGNPLSLVRR